MDPPSANHHQTSNHAKGRSLLGSLATFRGTNANQDPIDRVGGPATSKISSDFIITGNINCKGTAQFDGEVHGNIECNHLIVGKNGRIIGDIRAEDVVIFGSVEGAIHCLHVSLKTGASVKGDVYHKGISIEMGASFMGRSGLLPSGADEQQDSSQYTPASTPGATADHLVPGQARTST